MTLLDRDTHLYAIAGLGRELDTVEAKLTATGFIDLSQSLNKFQQDVGTQINLNEDTPANYTAQGEKDAKCVADYQPVTFERLSTLVTQLAGVLSPQEHSIELNAMRKILADAPSSSTNSLQPPQNKK